MYGGGARREPRIGSGPTVRMRRGRGLPPLFACVCVALALLLLLAAHAEDRDGIFRRPQCSGTALTRACPLDYSPVCGSDGITYANECALCISQLEKKVDIVIVKDGPC